MNRAYRVDRTALTALLSVALLSFAAFGQTVAIQAAAYIDADGRIATGGLVLVEDGVIAQVGGSPPEGVPVHTYADAVLSPGLIDCQAALGALGNLAESEDSIQPRANARDALDRYSQHLEAALAAGVTTFALVPDDQNLIGGRIAICQTSGPDGEPRLLCDDGPLKLSLSPAALSVDREPTSRGGALGLLRETLDAARQRESGDDPLAAFASGRLTGVFSTPSAADVLSVLDLAQQYGLRLALNHTSDAHLIAGQVSGRLAGVIVGPLDLQAPLRAARAPGLFESHGTPVALAGGLPTQSADSLRIAAAVATRAGMSLEAARRSITRVPAELLGVGARVGVLAPGHQADLVVFSGDPIDLRSRVLAVYVGGRRVYFGETNSPLGDRP